jgi:hypothetical protein
LTPTRAVARRSGNGVRVEFGRWVCSWCGATVDIAFDRCWRTDVVAAAGNGNVRVVTVDDAEVHRCACVHEAV